MLDAPRRRRILRRERGLVAPAFRRRFYGAIDIRASPAGGWRRRTQRAASPQEADSFTSLLASVVAFFVSDLESALGSNTWIAFPRLIAGGPIIFAFS